VVNTAGSALSLATRLKPGGKTDACCCGTMLEPGVSGTRELAT
jgi:hypothetical protein